MLLLTRAALGALLLTAAGLWCGQEAAAIWKRQRRCLEEMVRLLQQILDAVRYRRLPAGEILAELQQSGYVYTHSERCSTLQQLAPPDCLTGEAARRFQDCMRRVGHLAAQPQCEDLQRTIDWFAAQAAAIRQKEQAAAAVCPRVGLCVGAMAALALL